LTSIFQSDAFSQGANAKPSIRAEPKCPQLVKVVNGQPIRPGAFPWATTYASGEKKVFVTREMAMTPLEFETVAGFKMRVPASVLNISTEHCDAQGRLRSVSLDLYWVGGKLSASAELPELPAPRQFEYGFKLVKSFAHFFAGPYEDTSRESEVRLRGWRESLGPRRPLPQLGLTGYSMFQTSESKGILDVFEVDNARDPLGNPVTFLCSIPEADLLAGKFQSHDKFCDGRIGLRKGFGVRVRTGIEDLKDIAQISAQLIAVLGSYVVDK
jgi:hypothetical protein